MTHEQKCLLYESGELTASEAAEFESHLQGCGECRDGLTLARQAHEWAEILTVEFAERATSTSVLPIRGAFAVRRSGIVASAIGLFLLLALGRGSRTSLSSGRAELEKVMMETSRLSQELDALEGGRP